MHTVNKKTALIAVLAMVGGLSGCISGDVSTPIRFNDGFQVNQRYIQASNHWHDIAREVAQKMASASGVGTLTVEVRTEGVQGTPFETEFATFLESALIEAGIPVVESRGQVVVQVDGAVTRFDNARKARRLSWHERHQRPTLLGSQRWLSIPLPGMQEIPDYELNLSVRGTNDNSVVFAYAETFYVPEVDFSLYSRYVPSGRLYKVTP